MPPNGGWIVTQQHIAKTTNISLRTYQRIEAGESPITDKRMQNISKALGTTPDLIRTFDDKMVSVNTLHAKRDGIAIYHAPTTSAAQDPRDALIESLYAQIKLQEEKVRQLEGDC